MIRGRTLLLGVAGLLLVASSSAAQTPTRNDLRQPLFAPAPPEPSVRGPALPEAQAKKLAEARSLRLAGQTERAKQMLQSLLSEAPHHPMVLQELAQALADREDWAGIERLARSERKATRDPLLLGHEMVQALDHLGRWRESAQIAIEVWSVAPSEEDWAMAVISRQSGAEARAAREQVRRAAERMPERTDLARGAARLEARAGDVRPALHALGASDRAEGRWRLRWTFAEELIGTGVPADSVSASEVLLDLAGDPAADAGYRVAAAQRAWDISFARRQSREGADRIRRALADLPAAQWSPQLRLQVARELREAGRTAEVRELLAATGGRDAAPDFELERLITDLREGPPERVLPRLRAMALAGGNDAAFRYAEALFFAGQSDSAHAWYTKAAGDPSTPHAGAALQRLYLLEETSSPQAIPVFGEIAYSEWRGDRIRFRTLADSLYGELPRGPLWAQAALLASEAHDDDPRLALAPVIAVAESLPGDRLAPLARERAGDLYAGPLRDETQAIHQYEECLARYPRAWNAAEVRRKLEQLRREKRL